MGFSPIVQLSPSEAEWIWFLHEDLRMSFSSDQFFSVGRQTVEVIMFFVPGPFKKIVPFVEAKEAAYGKATWYG
jgi:hypothetical protein